PRGVEVRVLSWAPLNTGSVAFRSAGAVRLLQQGAPVLLHALVALAVDPHHAILELVGAGLVTARHAAVLVVLGLLLGCGDAAGYKCAQQKDQSGSAERSHGT